MPFRSQHTLELWLEEFRALGHPIRGSVKVMHQDGEDGENTGLVGVQLANAGTVIYIQPDADDPSRWAITMEAREEPVTVGAAAAADLATELRTVAALCAFLEAKSAASAADSAED